MPAPERRRLARPAMPARRWVDRLSAAVTAAWLRRGPLAWSLLPVAVLYGLLTGLRRALYRRGALKRTALPTPVLVVGNRVAGGAGKTPTTIAIVQHLTARGWQVGVVSRGHGGRTDGTQELGLAATASQVGDEPLLIRRRCGVPVVVGRDRVAAARSLLATHPQLDLIVCDDGLQHLRLARDIEVVVFDERGAGNGWLLPAGPLRESIHTPSLARHQLTLYNAEQPSTALAGHTGRRRLVGASRLRDWWQGAAARPWPEVRAITGDSAGWLAAAGLAVPERFFQQLEQAGLHVRALPLGDHFAFDHLPWSPDEVLVIVTEKDAVKLDPQRLARERPRCEVWVAALDFEPAPAFFAELDAALQATRSTRLRPPPASPASST